MATRSMFVFSSAIREEVEPFIEKWHYSKKLPSSMKYAFAMRHPGGLFGDTGEIAACCCYAEPIMPGGRIGDELELIRLARVEPDPEGMHLSVLVAKSLKWLATHVWPKYQIVVSYADQTHEHHGGIYQATNFVYVGKRGGKIGHWQDPKMGDVIHDRHAHERYNTGSGKTLRSLGLKPVYAKEKYLYVFSLARGEKAKAAMLFAKGYEPQVFPKPDWPGGLKPTDEEKAHERV